MKTAPANPRHVLRGILRLSRTPSLPPELTRKARPPEDAAGPTAARNPTRAFVLERYRAQHGRILNLSHPHSQAGTSSTEGSLEQEQRLLNLMAGTFHQLQLDLAERGRLYALDTGAEVVLTPKEISRRAAARAGLMLPRQPTLEDLQGYGNDEPRKDPS